MLALAESTGFTLASEVLLWSVPALLAVRAGLRSPRGERAVWWVVASACTVITLDKALDLQNVAHELGKRLVWTFAPGLTSSGGRPLARLALLGGLLLVASGVLYLLVRRDRAIGRSKRLSLSGLVLVMSYLGARLAPGLQDWFGMATPAGVGWSGVGLAVELACWLLVVAGVCASPAILCSP